MRLKKVAATLAAVLFLSSGVFAGEVDKLATVLAEKGVITYGEAQQIITETKEEMRQQTLSGTNPLLPKWVQSMTVKGDIRLRHQMDWGGSNKTRNRERIRVRLGVEAGIFDNVTAAFGLASGALAGSGDKSPTSTNHTYEAFNKVPVFIDYAYLQYKGISDLTISAGKVKGKTQVWNATDLVWDGDINPDGIALNYNKKFNGGVSMFANAGWYVVGEGKKGRLMPDAYIVQPGLSFKSGNFSIKAGLAYQQFNFKDREVKSNEPESYLQVSTITAVAKSDFRCINPSIELKMENIVGDLMVSVFGDYVKNTDDTVYEKDLEGKAFGLSFGSKKIAELGTWQVKVMNRYLEKNAIPLGLGDSDAYGGKDGKGYEFILTLGITKNLSFGFDYYEMEKIKGGSKKSLAQFDLSYKF